MRKTKLKKWQITATVFTLATMLGVGVFCGCSEISFPMKETETAYISGGMFLPEETNGNGVKLMSAKIAPMSYAEYGISEQAESVQTVTAIIEPTSETANVTVNWSLEFKNASSEWANGKVFTDYVTATVSPTDNKSVLLTCLQAFAEPIILTASAMIKGVECTATTRIEYYQKITSASLAVGSLQVSDNSDKTVAFVPVHYYDPSTTHGNGGTVQLKYELSSIYTIAQNVTATAKFQLNTDFSDMETYGNNPCYSYTGTDNGEIALENGSSFYFDTTCSPFRLIKYTSREGEVSFSSGGYDNGFDRCVQAFYSTTRPLGTLTYTVAGAYESITYAVQVYATASPSLSVSDSTVMF